MRGVERYARWGRGRRTRRRFLPGRRPRALLHTRIVRLAMAATLALLGALPARAAASGVHAAYFYHYMPVDHLDSLAAAHFDRAAIRWITDSLGTAGVTKLQAFVARGQACHVEVVPGWALQAPSRLTALGTTRRYTWSAGGAETREASVGCPLDSAFWQSALVDRAEEVLAAAPGVRRMLVDLEFYNASRHHYDGGPCHCTACLREYLAGLPAGAPVPSELSGLAGFEEARLTALLTRLLAGFAARHPGVQLGMFDLDLESFVHRALARALARDSIPAADWTERTYGTGAGPLPFVRARLTALGLSRAEVLGGLWLKRWTPDVLPGVAQGVVAGAGGWFAFTTYSLWQDPSKLTGPYTLPASVAAYWTALRQANTTP